MEQTCHKQGHTIQYNTIQYTPLFIKMIFSTSISNMRYYFGKGSLWICQAKFPLHKLYYSFIKTLYFMYFTMVFPYIVMIFLYITMVFPYIVMIFPMHYHGIPIHCNDIPYALPWYSHTL